MSKLHSKEMLTHRAPTFEDIAVENRKRMELMGIMPNNKAAEHALMQMMSCVGEMATLSYRITTSLSPFERDEVHSVIGKMAVCLATMGEAFDVSVGQAALDNISEQLLKSNDASSTRIKRELKKPVPLRHLQDGSENVLPNGQEEKSVLLSPTSNRDYFLRLDELITYGPGEFEKANLKWVAPSPGGTIRELIEDGSTINVRYEDLPKYLDMVEGFRSARSQGVHPSTVYPHVAQRARVVSKPIAVNAATREGATVKDEFLFSPTNHENNSLFSPPTHMLAANSDDGWIPTVLSHQEVSATKTTSKDAPTGETGSSDTDFFSKVAAIKNGTVAGAQISQLNLTFSVPRSGKLVELVPNGIHVQVTSSNVTEFLRLLEDKTALQNGRVRRLESIKKLEVTGAGPQGLSREKDKFSPTHFSKDIFAPYEDRTSFFIDCDASDEILPVYIKQREQQQKNTESEYVRVVRQGDVRKWRSILEEAKGDSSAFKKYGITFCVPGAAVLNAKEEEQESNVRELIKGGASTPVEEAQIWLFFRMIEDFFDI